MERMKLRKHYAVPKADLICLTPEDAIAVDKPWTNSGDSWWWSGGFNHWGLTPTPTDSAFGAQYNWYTDDSQNPDFK